VTGGKVASAGFCLVLLATVMVALGSGAGSAGAAAFASASSNPQPPSWTADPGVQTAQIWNNDPATSPPVPGASANFERVAASDGSGEMLRVYFVYPAGYQDPDICLSGAPFTSYVAAKGACSPILVICPSLPQPHFTFSGTATTGEYLIPIGTTWAGDNMYVQLRLTVPGNFAFPGAVSGSPFFGNVRVPPPGMSSGSNSSACAASTSPPSTTSTTQAPGAVLGTNTTNTTGQPAVLGTTAEMAPAAQPAVAPAASAPAQVLGTQAAASQLPRTGSHAGELVLIALGLVVLGLAMTGGSRLARTAAARRG
jgi:hypothetical protein